MDYKLFPLAAMLLLAGCAAPVDLPLECPEDQSMADGHDDHSHSDMDDAGGMDDMSHGPYEVPDCEGTPSVQFTAMPDMMAGINVHVELTDFQFAPHLVSTDHKAGKGHAHIYLDGVKIGRIYNEWVHLAATEGTHTIQVTLNSNNHSDLYVGGEQVQQTVSVDVPAPSSHMDMGTHDGTGMDVSIALTPDPKGPANQLLEITTSGFQFDGASASTAHEQGNGHAHVYLDGVKLGRIYGNYYHLGGLEPGEHTVRVSLNGNDHHDYVIDGEPVSAELTFQS